MGYDIVIRRYKIKMRLKYVFFDDFVKIKIISLKILYVILNIYIKINNKFQNWSIYMPTHCIKKIKEATDIAILNAIKEWKAELLRKGHLSMERNGETIYFEGSFIECSETLNKLHDKAEDIFNVFVIDYEEE
jgi:hypothetical protein